MAETDKNYGMLRGSGLRADRLAIDYGDDGTKRVGTNPTRINQGTSRGASINFYDDLGISTDANTATGLRQEEKAFKERVAVDTANIAKAQSQYDTAYGSLTQAKSQYEAAKAKVPTLSSAVNSAWSSYKSTLTPVRVIGPNDTIEAVYYLPKEAANSLQGQRGIFASYVDNGANFNVMAKNYRNQELHDSLRVSAAQLEAGYKANAAESLKEQIAKANASLAEQAASIGEAEGQLANYKGQISSMQGQLNAAKQSREDQWNLIRQKQENRRQTMAEIFGGLNVG